MIQEYIDGRTASIQRRIQSKGPQAVFVIDDLVRSANARGELAEKIISENPRSLVGVYDSNAKFDWIAGDIAYVSNYRN